MTWNKLAEAIAALPAESREQEANVFMQQTGEQAIIIALDKAADWGEPAEQIHTLIYER